MSLEEIEARVILSTKRKKRNYSLVTIADDIIKLKNKYGSIAEVAKTIGISSGMLNQFLKVNYLSDKIKNLVGKRKVDSVTIVSNLSKFSKEDQNILINYILDKNLNSQDLRYLSPLRKENPNRAIEDLVKQTLYSKGIRVSVIQFSQKDFARSIEDFERDIKNIIGEDNFI